jgi:hypothetical protein
MIGGACGGQHAQFQPTEHASATSPSGQPAASYEIRTEPGSDPKIKVNVWSEGAKRDSGHTYIDFAMEIQNTSDQSVTLDRNQLALEAFNSKGASLPPGRLVSLNAEDRSLVIPPGSAQTLRFRYELPVPVAPDQISSLRLRWGVAESDGERYVQFTEFRRQPEVPDTATYIVYDPVFGLYDPFFYPPPIIVHHERVVPVGATVPHDRRRAAR